MGRRWIAVLAVMVFGAASCGDTASTTTEPAPTTTSTATTSTTSSTTTSPTTPPPPATTAPPATTVPPTSTLPPVTTTTPPTGGSFVVGTPSLFPPDPLVGSDGARGSGCSPGPGALPDGVWFGFVDGGAAVMDFDLACFYFGDIAWEKAAEQGDEAPNDFYISNQSTARRTVALDAATPVHWITADVEFALSPYGDWVADPAGYSNCPGEFCLVWLYVNGGAVTEILEQYLP